VPVTRTDSGASKPPASNAAPGRTLRLWQLACLALLVTLPVLTAALVYYTLPFEARRAVAAAPGFNRLPAHAWLQQKLLRQATFNQQVVLKPDEVLAIGVTLLRTTHLKGELFFHDPPTNTVRLKVLIEVGRDGFGAVPFAQAEAGPGAEQVGLFSERLGPGFYTFTLECAGGLEAKTRADLILRLES
jgi:hypothetical protein